ncbi:acetylglutamate kinase [Arenicella chitinivorans]|uniref:Acetylglutamate kinase n=1 Tax=Arenicella chitinivorans TaxID=1329800 RepID=A0A918RJB7_9GAMM|nr:acetylglutamate kinase [Arenicella chitinivorans]GGZ98609.1 acetylglutamate kinase [Arenicella chitinivorans]
MTAKQEQTAVIKVGGDMLATPEDRRALAQNVGDLIRAGWRCVILHGGGPQLNRLQTVYGLTPNKVEGRRITSAEDLQVVKQALCGEVNVDLVASLLAGGVPAFGCHGASGQLIQAQKRPPMDFGARGIIDLGEVGDVTDVNVHAIECLLNGGFVPVIASLGVDVDGRVFNINADTTVAAIARAMQADLLLLSTRVGGVFADITDPASRIKSMTAAESEALIQQGVITDGMIPKLRESFALLDHGVGTIAIGNAASQGAFLALATGSDRAGTRLITG